MNEPLIHPIFTNEDRAAFRLYLAEHPSSRRVSRAEQESLVQWLTHSNSKPSSQKEFSRRHYIHKTFRWEGATQTMRTLPRREAEPSRLVVVAESILDVVERVHLSNGHGGWDATWKDISQAYYGILRADVHFLLKRCSVCVQNPRKRPKSAGVHHPHEPSSMAAAPLISEEFSMGEFIEAGCWHDE